MCWPFNNGFIQLLTNRFTKHFIEYYWRHFCKALMLDKQWFQEKNLLFKTIGPASHRWHFSIIPYLCTTKAGFDKEVGHFQFFCMELVVSRGEARHLVSNNSITRTLFFCDWAILRNRAQINTRFRGETLPALKWPLRRSCVLSFHDGKEVLYQGMSGGLKTAALLGCFDRFSA